MRYLLGLPSEDELPKRFSFLLSISLFIVILVLYFTVSYFRHLENPQDKIVPNLQQLTVGITRSLSLDQQGQIPLLIDTLSSLGRLAGGLILATIISLIIGVSLAIIPFFNKIFFKFLLYFGKVPPLALLPILFITTGLGERTKIILIILALVPPVAMDIFFKIKSLPREQFIRARTFGATFATFVRHIVLPQITPSTLNALRINLLNAWVFLIAAESIAANSGLGYRIFVVRRYLAMETIIPYVLWIAFLAFTIDMILAYWLKKRYVWYNA